MNKKTIFPLDIKLVSASRNEQFVKKIHLRLTEKLFLQPGLSDK